ncbi:Aldolase-type TIM barrel [Acididesulfobacillus acetoxydans]|uniref:Aldolase-type TIM barrel n=1 Tax=Acididesulfobacillus acetoxydans TaxID=1561005 RepID=A0A8S0W9T1_9FIRM|nr:radical SAM protein [Acididesulfobacillus acetoxydans]CAA7602859.1 Aldolase-type TIM barrel [Acididesulfobacillus acetoxydans]CEJ05740.1 Biotin synthase-related enzyme [Acididesulfobacillus acetoxydans]
MIRCSLGTAQVLGLKRVKVDALPTTAYLMIGEHCRFNCAFCAQARESSARADLLSRVSWPAYEDAQVLGALESFAETADQDRTREDAQVPGAFGGPPSLQGSGENAGVSAAPGAAGAAQSPVLRRVCFQVVQDREALAEAKKWLREVRKRFALPICVSAGPGTPEEVGELLRQGADHVSIALDAATAEVFARVKDGSWSERYALLRDSARRYPGRIATHLIVGLGESEEDMVRRLAEMYQLGVTVALFAFTPVRGTRLESVGAPDIGHYRRVQAANYLLREHLADIGGFRFAGGRIEAFGVDRDELRAYLADGEAFRTSGCEGCNRPYYNEVPGRELYNYPRPLTEKEKEGAWRRLWEPPVKGIQAMGKP